MGEKEGREGGEGREGERGQGEGRKECGEGGMEERRELHVHVYKCRVLTMQADMRGGKNDELSLGN